MLSFFRLDLGKLIVKMHKLHDQLEAHVAAKAAETVDAERKAAALAVEHKQASSFLAGVKTLLGE